MSLLRPINFDCRMPQMKQSFSARERQESSRFGKFASAASFRPRGWQWVDPQKEINAAVTAMHNGVMSMQDVAGQYGRDVEETFSQWQRDKEMADTFGLDLAFFPFGGNEGTKGVEMSDDSDADDETGA